MAEHAVFSNYQKLSHSLWCFLNGSTVKIIPLNNKLPLREWKSPEERQNNIQDKCDQSYKAPSLVLSCMKWTSCIWVPGSCTLLLKASQPAALYRQVVAALQTLWLGSTCRAAIVCSVHLSGRSSEKVLPLILFSARRRLGLFRADRMCSEKRVKIRRSQWQLVLLSLI